MEHCATRCGCAASSPSPNCHYRHGCDGALVTRSAFCDRWEDYGNDMVDLHRVYLFDLARAHGISRDEAAIFVTGAEHGNSRRTTKDAVLRLQHEVPKRAAANHGRYYIANSFGWVPMDPVDWDLAVAEADQAVIRRRGKNAFFMSSPRFRVSRRKTR